MAKTPEKIAAKVTKRQARIAAARVRLEAKIKAGHPKSKAYQARLAEYDAAEKRLSLA